MGVWERSIVQSSTRAVVCIRFARRFETFPLFAATEADDFTHRRVLLPTVHPASRGFHVARHDWLVRRESFRVPRPPSRVHTPPFVPKKYERKKYQFDIRNTEARSG